MLLKRILGMIIFLGALVSEAYPSYTSPVYKQGQHSHSFATASYDKQLREMKRQYSATPCKDQALINELNALQSKLNITPQVPLFITQKPTAKLPKNTLAFYVPQLQTITIVACNFYNLKPLERTQTLCHELRHHLQNTTQKAYSAVIAYGHLKKLTYAQAAEYDADDFGIRQATNNCPTCIKELKKCFSPKADNPAGYFTQRDFAPILQEANQAPNFCAAHKQYNKVKDDTCYTSKTNQTITCEMDTYLLLPTIMLLCYKYRHILIQTYKSLKDSYV